MIESRFELYLPDGVTSGQIIGYRDGEVKKRVYYRNGKFIGPTPEKEEELKKIIDEFLIALKTFVNINELKDE